MSKVEWNAPTSPDAAARRAGGRRKYNSIRQLEAHLRRQEVAAGLRRYGWRRGVQARLARELGVSESTISRDVAHLLFNLSPCPICDTPVARERWEYLARRGRVRIEYDGTRAFPTSFGRGGG